MTVVELAESFQWWLGQQHYLPEDAWKNYLIEHPDAASAEEVQEAVRWLLRTTCLEPAPGPVDNDGLPVRVQLSRS